LILCYQLLTVFTVASVPLPVVLQLSQAHTDHKKLRDQYSAEILARNADLASLEAAEQRAAQLQEQLTAAQDASTQALAAQQRSAEQAAASVAAAAAARSEAEGRCARLQSALDAMNAQLRHMAEAQAGGFALTEESEYGCCCARLHMHFTHA
jgi:chromosome segregation ATPase